MICLIALVVFAVLGIFSAAHRALAKEAFDCVFRRVTLRKCTTGFDTKMKLKIATKLLKKSQRLGRFVFKHFEALSWVFIFLMISSFVVTVVGAYNFVAYGNCNGPHSTERCMLNPTGSLGCGSEHCAAEGCECGTKESNCTADNNYAACKGKCDCNPEVCG